MRYFTKRILLFIILLGLGCAGANRQRPSADFQPRIAALQAEIENNPNDAQLWRELGITYLEGRQYQPARQSLLQAAKREPGDAKTLFYLGLVLEFEKRTKLAMAVYQSYRRAPRFSSYRRLMRARHYHLSRRLLREEIRALLQQEQQLSAGSVATNAVAVFPLQYLGKNEEVAALRKGLAEMMITDLSQVKTIEVVDRVRVQALLNEMALGQSGMVDEATAAKAGSLIRAGKIVRGSYRLQEKDKLSVEVAFWDVNQQASPTATTHSDLLKNLFRLEKEIVFAVIDAMGIELTPAEREMIQRVPTQNLRAFMHYCSGLLEEDAGNFAPAAKSYLKAAELDPKFSQAIDRAEAMDELSAIGGDPEQVLKEALALEQPDNRDGESSVTEERLENLQENIDSNFEPGQDSRDATDSAFDLPLRRPPPPPR
jgi:TolB-like protein